MFPIGSTLDADWVHYNNMHLAMENHSFPVIVNDKGLPRVPIENRCALPNHLRHSLTDS